MVLGCSVLLLTHARLSGERHIDGIINSMTPWEREHSDKIDRSRRNRIARGSGSAPNEITNLLKQFEAMSRMMAKMSNMGFLERMRAVQEISKGGMAIPGVDMPMPKQRSSRGIADPVAAREALKTDPRLVAQRNLQRLESAINELLQVFRVHFVIKVATDGTPRAVIWF